MEKFTIKNNQRYQFFGRHRNLISIIQIFDFLTLEENLKLAQLNSLIFKSVKKEKRSDLFVKIKQKFPPPHMITFDFLDSLLKEITQSHSEQELEIISEFLAFYAFKNIFCRFIKFKNNNEHQTMKILKHLIKWNDKFASKFFVVNDIEFEIRNTNFLISLFLEKCPNLVNITVTNSKLTDESLENFLPYINNLTTLNLSGNEIGLTDKANDFLLSIENNKSLNHLCLDSCYFTTSSIDFIKKIYFSKNNNLMSFTLYLNLFSLESAKNLFEIESNCFEKFNQNKFLGISFRYSPDYILNYNQREVKFSNSFICSQYDVNDFHLIYLDELKFENLTIEKFDSRIAYMLEPIFFYNNLLLGLHLNMSPICHWTSLAILRILRMDKLEILSLKNDSSSINLKFFEILKVIKDLKNLRNLKLENINSAELHEELEKILPQSSLENLQVQVEKMIDSKALYKDKNKKLFNNIGLNEATPRKVFA
jgi:hypothetical protein